MKKNKLRFLFWGILLCFVSCETTESLSCPYVLANPEVKLGESDDSQRFAGMSFSVFNDSEKVIERFTVSFMLYDSEGKNPFVGSNCIVSRCDCHILPGAVEKFTVSLDSFISVVPEEPYLVDFLYLREIRYSDGSSWSDPYGMYCVREIQE